MKYLYQPLFFCCIMLIAFTTKSQTTITPKGLINPSFGLNGGEIEGAAFAVTKTGYTYAAGSFSNTVDFDLTADTFNISSTFGYNIFISKYDKFSKLVFAFKLSGLSGTDAVYAVASDKDDNIYVTGFFTSSLDFDPGPGVAQLNTGDYYNTDNFIAKYDKNGNFIFVKQLTTNNNPAYINSIKVDDEGNIFIAGHGITRKIDFDPGAGVVHPSSYGKEDAFFAKYDAQGNLVFVKAVGGGRDDLCWGFAINKNQDILITGSYESSDNDFNPDTGKINLPLAGISNAYIATYDSAGNYKSAFGLGNTKNNVGYDIISDNDTNIIVSGLFSGTVDFSPDNTTTTISSDADEDHFLAKYTKNGKLIFVKDIRAAKPAFSRVIIDNNNNIYIAGGFSKSVSFNGIDSLKSKGNTDIFWAKYSNNGTYNFSNQIGGSNYDYVRSLILRSNNQLYIVGTFSDTCYFNTGNSVKLVTPNANVFISTYNTSGNIINANDFDTYRRFNVQSKIIKTAHDEQSNMYVAGTFEGIVDFDPGIKQYILTSSQDADSRQLFTSLTDDIFFAKYDVTGKLIFAKDIGGTKGQAPISIAVDAKHNIYLTGTFEGNIDVDPGADSSILYSKQNSLLESFFISKYDSLGNYIFAKPIYVSGSLTAATLDNNNNIYITGSFSNAQFNPEDTSLTKVRGLYIYFTKYDRNGKFIYAKSVGQDNLNQGAGDIAVNSKGNVLLCGSINGSQIDFDPGVGTHYINTNAALVHFVAAYTASGNFLFETNSTTTNTTSSANAYLLRVDKNDNIVVSGTIKGTLDFDPGTDTLFGTGQGAYSFFFMRYNAKGKPLFVNTFSVPNVLNNLNMQALAIDDNNNIYTAGYFTGEVDFDAGADTAYLTADSSLHSNLNVFLSKYDSSGKYIYAYNFAPTDTFFSRSANVGDLWINKNADINFSVNTNGKIDFDPGPDTFYYHPPFDVYPSSNQAYSFVTVKFKQTQNIKPFMFAKLYNTGIKSICKKYGINLTADKDDINYPCVLTASTSAF